MSGSDFIKGKVMQCLGEASKRCTAQASELRLQKADHQSGCSKNIYLTISDFYRFRSGYSSEKSRNTGFPHFMGVYE